MHAHASGTVALITRPGEAGQRLSAQLRDMGQDALWWPAFDLMAPEDPEPLRGLWRRLDSFDLVVFVSPGAVRGWASLELPGPWPAATAIAAPGAATVQLARTLMAGAAAAPAIAPAAAAGGSEALWEALHELSPLPRKVLIVRAESGREWLAAQLRAAGADVEYVCVYRRVLHTPSAPLLASFQAFRDGGAVAAPLVTSTEAVAALDCQLEQMPEARAWLRHGLALCSHPRIGEALQAAGYAHVRPCEPTAAAVMEAIDGSGDVALAAGPIEASAP